MRHIFLVIIAALLLGYVSPAQAAPPGQLFPPIGQSGSSSCANGQGLTWNAGSLKCTNPSPAVSTTPTKCPTGQVLSGVKNGQATCIVPPIPTIKCAAGYAIQEIKGSTTPKCINIKSASASTLVCGAGKAIQKVSGEVVTCIDVDSGDTTTVTCPTGKAVQKINNGTVTCVDIGTGTASLTVSCPNGQALQKIIDGVPYCTMIGSSNLAMSCGTNEVMKGIMANGDPICVTTNVPGTLSLRVSATWNQISTNCVDPVVPKPDPWQPGLSPLQHIELLSRWVNTCGARWCRSLDEGYVTGKVSEYSGGTALIDCW